MATTAAAHTPSDKVMTTQTSNSCIPTNSLCFIYRLPVETTEEIFILCACDYHWEASGDPTPSAPSWINVSYVSRHWRNVALNCSTLWTYLFITSPRWTEELLNRSQQSSLKLKVNLTSRYEKRSHFVEQVMDHVERIQELHLNLSVGAYRLLSEHSSCASRLQYLKISADDVSEDWSSVLFDGDTPALRTLELAGCPLSWYSFKLTSLTTLRLRSVPVQFQQKMEEFLATLGNMQNLMHLYLRDAVGFRVSSLAFNSSQKISLPRLAHLTIVDTFSTVITLLSCLNIPSNTQVRLTANTLRERNSPSLDDYSALSSLLAHRLNIFEDQALSSPTIRTLVVASSEQGEATITFSTLERHPRSFDDLSRVEPDCDIPLQVTLLFHQSMTRSDRHRVVGRICCPIPLPSVQTLHFINPPFPAVFWTQFLEHLEGLRYIKLSKARMPDIAPVLSLPLHAHAMHQGGHIDRGFTPALEELEIYDSVFSIARERDFMYLPAADVQSLCDALSTRKESRGRLVVSGCTESSSNGQKKAFDMEGQWEGGRFDIVDYKQKEAGLV